jgi:hypothetical protein
MNRRRLAKTQKIRLVIDGVCLQSTVALLRTGSISVMLGRAWEQFEIEHQSRGIMGKLARYHDDYLGRDVDIQFDVY